MLEVKVLIVTEHGELLEQFKLSELDKDQPASQELLAGRVRDYLEHRFETKEV